MGMILGPESAKQAGYVSDRDQGEAFFSELLRIVGRPYEIEECVG
jgi:hypothetical protein